MAWVAPVVSLATGVLGGLLKNRGDKQARGTQFQQALWQYNPNRIQNSAAALNPWLAQLFGMPNKYNSWRPGNDGFMGDLRKLYEGQDISPWLLNQPLNQINQGANQNLARMQALIGRQGAQGGLANLYGLANLGGRNQALAGAMQQYGQWREGQRRTDIWNILQNWMGSQQLAAGLNQQQAQMMPGPAQNSAQMWGGALPFLAQSGMNIYGATRQPQSSVQTGRMGQPGFQYPFAG